MVAIETKARGLMVDAASKCGSFHSVPYCGPESHLKAATELASRIGYYGNFLCHGSCEGHVFIYFGE